MEEGPGQHYARRRNPNTEKSLLQRFDVFGKQMDDVQETSSSGGAVTMLTFMVMISLMISEIWYFRSFDHSTSYRVDVTRNGSNKMELYIDLDIKTECELIASDVIDMSGGMVQSEFTKVPIIYDLDEHQEGWWRENQEAASVDRSHSLEGQPPHLSRFHSTTLFINSQEMPENDTDDAVKRDGCRIHGAVDVAMVKGNFHFTGGELKANTGNKHIHTNIPLAKMNFTHRIRHLSFAHPGEHYPDLVSGLDGSDAVIESMLGSTQYHLNVVPTEYEYASASILWDNVGSQVKNWYTYSYMKDPKEGFPGIFFTFDITALKMHVKEHNRSILTAIIRLVGLLGGVFATSDMIHRFVIRSVATVRRQSTDFHSLLRDSSSGSLSSASVLAFDMPSAPKPA